MADPHEFDDVMPENTSRREPEQPVEENLFTRLVYMIIIALMISFAGTVIGVLAFWRCCSSSLCWLTRNNPMSGLQSLAPMSGFGWPKRHGIKRLRPKINHGLGPNLTDKVSQVRGGVWQFPLRNLRASLRNWGA
jgi:hypothetical protein